MARKNLRGEAKTFNGLFVGPAKIALPPGFAPAGPTKGPSPFYPAAFNRSSDTKEPKASHADHGRPSCMGGEKASLAIRSYLYLKRVRGDRERQAIDSRTVAPCRGG